MYGCNYSIILCPGSSQLGRFTRIFCSFFVLKDEKRTRLPFFLLRIFRPKKGRVQKKDKISGTSEFVLKKDPEISSFFRPFLGRKKGRGRKKDEISISPSTHHENTAPIVLLTLFTCPRPFLCTRTFHTAQCASSHIIISSRQLNNR
jgi:hypothetical protein